MSNYVIKISQEGHDVHLADYNELTFTSEFPLLKIHKQGYHTISLDWGSDPQPPITQRALSGEVRIKHDVGKRPMFLAYTQYHNVAQNSVKQPSFKQFSWIDIITSVTDPYVINTNEYTAYTTDMYLVMHWVIRLPLVKAEHLDFFYFIFDEPQTNEDYNIVGENLENFAGNSISGQAIAGKPFNSNS